MNHLQTLTRYKAWADELFLSTVSQLPEKELIAPRPILFGSIIRTLHHSYAMDRVWQAHLLGEAHGYTTRNPDEHPAFEELRKNQLVMDAWYVGYADSLDADVVTPALARNRSSEVDGRFRIVDEQLPQPILAIPDRLAVHRDHVAKGRRPRARAGLHQQEVRFQRAGLLHGSVGAHQALLLGFLRHDGRKRLDVGGHVAPRLLHDGGDARIGPLRLDAREPAHRKGGRR